MASSPVTENVRQEKGQKFFGPETSGLRWGCRPRKGVGVERYLVDVSDIFYFFLLGGGERESEGPGGVGAIFN